jgi:hypothetical protein
MAFLHLLISHMMSQIIFLHRYRSFKRKSSYGNIKTTFFFIGLSLELEKGGVGRLNRGQRINLKRSLLTFFRGFKKIRKKQQQKKQEVFSGTISSVLKMNSLFNA